MDTEITLAPVTAEMYHDFFREYQNDPDLYLDRSQFSVYRYDKEKVDRYIQRQIDLGRKTLAIMRCGEMIGEIVIKDIKPCQSAVLGITMKNDRFKNRGFGTAAERLAIQYVFYEMDIPVLYADAVLTNLRSQHVLQKAGFTLVGEDETFRYYQIKR